MMKVTAKDTIGNEFVKTVTTKILQDGYCEGELVIDFGWPVQYIANHLMDLYPFQKPMIIDLAGRNHKGHQVCIDAEQMNKVVERFVLN